jgi:hypothetical protein
LILFTAENPLSTSAFDIGSEKYILSSSDNSSKPIWNCWFDKTYSMMLVLLWISCFFRIFPDSKFDLIRLQVNRVLF